MASIEVKESRIIRPAEETPKHCLRISDLDLMVRSFHASNVFFYRPPNDSTNFCDITKLLKHSLSQVLVLFYPMAGRFGRDENGRIQIECNGEGILFQVAETSCAIDDFSEAFKLQQFVPTVDTTKDISSYPILMTQVTHFKCGGVSLGVALHHTLADGISAFSLIKAWAEMTRGLPVSIPPSFDSTSLGIGVPTSPKFHHFEYDPAPSTNNSNQNLGPISPAILRLSPDQINFLRKTNHGSSVKYSRFEIIAAHIWRCMCKARELPDDQASKLYISTNGRSRLNPPLPPGFVGNVLFPTTLMALSGNIISEPLNFTIERIHKALKRMDDEYLKSALAYLKQVPDPTVLQRGDNTCNRPNLKLSNVSVLPIYDANFGWGRPMFVRPLVATEGSTHIFPSPSDDGSLLICINLESHRIQLFKKLFYEIFVEPRNARSRY